MINQRESWDYDHNRRQWFVKVNDQKIYVGDMVKVRFKNGTFEGRVKQVAGFGPNEPRDVISVLFPGRKNGVKVSIRNIVK